MSLSLSLSLSLSSLVENSRRQRRSACGGARLAAASKMLAHCWRWPSHPAFGFQLSLPDTPIAAMSDEEVVPKHAHLWLTPEQQEEWVTAKKQVPTLIFASFVAFNALAGLSLKIVNRKGLVTHPKNKALLQYGCAWQTPRWEVRPPSCNRFTFLHSAAAACRRRLLPPPAPTNFDHPAHPASSLPPAIRPAASCQPPTPCCPWLPQST